ncbi:hypothetical protein ERO13_A05G003850v2 [Gossypium hirsutum]|nr:hypothetical protein ERO13_A05G003850v2 [Gossypium hirsutum]
MSIASPSSSSQQSLLTSAFTFTRKPKTKPLTFVTSIACRYQSDDLKDSAWINEKQLAKIAIVTVASGVLTLGSVADASAAKTGGRVSGQSFKSSAPLLAPRTNSNSSEWYFSFTKMAFFVVFCQSSS